MQVSLIFNSVSQNSFFRPLSWITPIVLGILGVAYFRKQIHLEYRKFAVEKNSLYQITRGEMFKQLDAKQYWLLELYHDLFLVYGLNEQKEEFTIYTTSKQDALKKIQNLKKEFYTDGSRTFEENRLLCWTAFRKYSSLFERQVAWVKTKLDNDSYWLLPFKEFSLLLFKDHHGKTKPFFFKNNQSVNLQKWDGLNLSTNKKEEWLSSPATLSQIHEFFFFQGQNFSQMQEDSEPFCFKEYVFDTPPLFFALLQIKKRKKRELICFKRKEIFEEVKKKLLTKKYFLIS